MAFACVLLAPAPLNEMDCEPVALEAKEQFVAETAALPLNPSPPLKAKEHAAPVVARTATATSLTGVEPVPTTRAVKLRGIVRVMVAITAVQVDEQDPLLSAAKLPLLYVPGWIVTVVLLTP